MKYRWVLVALALLAASGFALSVQAGRWWTIGDVDVEIGPFGSHSRFSDASSLAWAGDAQWELFGTTTWAAGMIAMFVLVVLAGAIAARRVPRLVARTSLVAIATVTATAIGFIATRPENLPVTAGRGLVLFIAAVIAGVAVAICVLRAPGPPVLRLGSARDRS